MRALAWALLRARFSNSHIEAQETPHVQGQDSQVQDVRPEGKQHVAIQERCKLGDFRESSTRQGQDQEIASQVTSSQGLASERCIFGTSELGARSLEEEADRTHSSSA